MNIQLSYTDDEKGKFLSTLGYSIKKIQYQVIHGETAVTKKFETTESIIIAFKGQISTPLKRLIDKKYKVHSDFLVYSNELLHSAFDKEFSRKLLELTSKS